MGISPQKISLYEVVEPLENVTLWLECALGLKKCSDTTPCAVHHRWKVVRNTYYDFLKTTSIADFLKILNFFVVFIHTKIFLSRN